MDLIQQLTKWPDSLEVYADENGKRSYKFIVNRRNSRALNSEQQATCEHLQDMGCHVVVRIANVELELGQFLSQGVYGVKPPQFHSRQQLYNEQHTLKTLIEDLARTSQDDPRYEQLCRRIKLKKEMIEAAQSGAPIFDALKRSDDELRRLEKLVAQQTQPAQDEVAQYNEMPDELLWNVPLAKLTALIPKGGAAVLNRWHILKQQRYLDQLNAELTLQPDNLELRAKIIEEEDRLKQLISQRDAPKTPAQTQ